MLKVSPSDKILIISPHPDDESIGCGGLLSLYGRQCDVLLLTDGRLGRDADSEITQEQLVSLRKKEFIASMETAKVAHFFILDIPDQMVMLNKQIVRNFDLSSYSMIFIPHRREYHLDHKAVFPVVKRMMRRQKSSARLFEYEVWSPLVKPNRALILDDCFDKKLKLVDNYPSQIKLRNYNQLCTGLAEYRGIFFGTQYAEAYYETEKHSFLRTLYDCLPYRVRYLAHKVMRKG